MALELPPLEVSLADLTRMLVEIPSVSGDEAAISDFLYRWLVRSAVGEYDIQKIDENIVIRWPKSGSPRIAIAGHIDTVPPDPTDVVSLDGDRLFGVGSSDMKGGIATMAKLAQAGSFRYDLTMVFYVCEEVDLSRNGLRKVFSMMPSIAEVDAAILMEPTSNFVEAGCQGTLRAKVTLGGVRAHSARPWVGRNAIERLENFLGVLSKVERRTPMVDGVQYRESISSVRVEGGIANNVVPDAVSLWINHRFAPDRGPKEAFGALRGALVAGGALEVGDEMVLEDCAPGARPGVDGGPLADLVHQSLGVRAKLGWTDVAFFGEHGIPAVNYGPGDALVAHAKGESLELKELDEAYGTLVKLVVST